VTVPLLFTVFDRNAVAAGAEMVGIIAFDAEGRAKVHGLSLELREL
jgi:hypothetical protein